MTDVASNLRLLEAYFSLDEAFWTIWSEYGSGPDEQNDHLVQKAVHELIRHGDRYAARLVRLNMRSDGGRPWYDCDDYDWADATPADWDDGLLHCLRDDYYKAAQKAVGEMAREETG